MATVRRERRSRRGSAHERADGAEADDGPLPPGLKISSLNAAAISLPFVVDAIREEKGLREEIEGRKQKIRHWSLERQAEMGRSVVEVDRNVVVCNEQMDALAAERATIARKLEDLRYKQASLATARDAIVSADHQREAATQEIQRLRPSCEELKRKVAELEGQLSKASRAEDDAARKNTKGKSTAEQVTRDAASVQEINEKLTKERRKLAHAEEAIAKKVAICEEAEQRRTKMQEALAQSANYRTEYTTLRQRQTALQHDIDGVLKERRARTSKPQSKEVKELDAALDACRKELREKEAALKEVQGRIPFHCFRFNAEFRKSLLGVGGNLLKEMETDFGVAIQLDQGMAYVVGGPLETVQCIEAMRAVLLNAEARSHRETLTIEPALRPAIIGTSGTTIERIQSVSGANLNLKGESVVVTGTEEEVQAAMALLRDIIDRNARSAVHYDPSILDLVIGKRGAAIRKMMEETGVQHIHVDRSAHQIIITGPKDAVAAATDAYSALLKGLEKNMTSIPCDREGRSAVIGKGGAVVRDIESSTGARLDIRNNEISITAPSEESLRNAVALVMERIRSQDSIPVDNAAMALLSAAPEGDETTLLARIQQTHGLTAAQLVRKEGIVALRGPPEAVARAKAELMEWIGKTYETLTVPMTLMNMAKGAVTRAGGLVSQTSPEGQIVVAGPRETRAACAAAVAALSTEFAEFIVDVDVPASRIGAILGPRGTTLRGIEQKTNTSIVIDRVKNRVGIVSSKKKREDIDEAIALIKAAQTGELTATPAVGAERAPPIGGGRGVRSRRGRGGAPKSREGEAAGVPEESVTKAPSIE